MEFGVRIFVFHIRILTNIRFQCLSVEFNKFVRHTSCPILVLSNYFECFITLLLCFKLIVYPKRILKINFNSIVYRTFVDCFDVCWWSECMLEIKLLFSVPVFIFFKPTWIMSEKGGNLYSLMLKLTCMSYLLQSLSYILFVMSLVYEWNNRFIVDSWIGPALFCIYESPTEFCWRRIR